MHHVKTAEEMLAELDDLLTNSGISRCRSYVIMDDSALRKVTTFDCERALDHAGRYHKAVKDGITLTWTQV